MVSVGPDISPDVYEEKLEELRRKLLGPPPPPPRISPSVLDGLFASRTHVRVLRVLVFDGDRINLSARDVARRARASHGRVLEVLRHLSSLEVVDMKVMATHSIYRLNEEHHLERAIRRLFHDERHAAGATRTSP
jgi:hypothetical protein